MYKSSKMARKLLVAICAAWACTSRILQNPPESLFCQVQYLFSHHPIRVKDETDYTSTHRRSHVFCPYNRVGADPDHSV